MKEFRQDVKHLRSSLVYVFWTWGLIVAVVASFLAGMANGQSQGYSAIDGPDLACVPDVRGGVVEERHWQFVESWIAWCQFTARKVSQCSGRAWRARDVEMAVFTAQRCGLTLNPPT